MDSPLAGAIAVLGYIFESYKGENGKMTKAKFSEMLREHLPAWVEDGADDQLFRGVDFNDDGYVEFAEFTQLVAILALGHYEIFSQLMKEAEQQQKASK